MSSNFSIHLPEVDSTNAYLQRLLGHKELPHGFAVSADYQSLGRGQRASMWLSNPGENVLLSVYLKPKKLPVQEVFGISIAASLGVYQVVNHYFPNACLIKWPNDILLQNKKVAGMLIETQVSEGFVKEVVVGIGLNVNQAMASEALPQATSFFEITHGKFDLGTIRAQLIEHVISNVDQLPLGRKQLHESYLSKMLGLDKSRPFVLNGRQVMGVIRGIDRYGRLQVDIDDALQVFDAKEIAFIY